MKSNPFNCHRENCPAPAYRENEQGKWTCEGHLKSGGKQKAKFLGTQTRKGLYEYDAKNNRRILRAKPTPET